jgi:hypothetical protein
MQLEQGKKYNVVLTGEELALIQNALVELPFKFTASLIQSLPEKITEVKETKLEVVEG